MPFLANLGQLFGICGDYEPFVTGGDPQNIGGSGLPEGHTGGHDKMIRQFGKPFIY